MLFVLVVKLLLVLLLLLLLCIVLKLLVARNFMSFSVCTVQWDRLRSQCWQPSQAKTTREYETRRGLLEQCQSIAKIAKAIKIARILSLTSCFGKTLTFLSHQLEANRKWIQATNTFRWHLQNGMSSCTFCHFQFASCTELSTESENLKK